MIDFAKLYCDLHPNEIITNFCLKESCMLALCATCICTHTQHHVNNKTTPEYQNIRTTFSTIHELIRKKITSLQNQKNRIEKITEFIHTKRTALKQNIEQTRKQALTVVNNFFDNKQKYMFREMESEEKKMGLHCEARMESLMNSLSRQTTLLITSAQQLNSKNFLESYQRIRTQTIYNATKLEDEVAKQLSKNQNFETVIKVNEQYIQNLIKVLEQSLSLNFKINPENSAKIYQFSQIENQFTVKNKGCTRLVTDPHENSAELLQTRKNCFAEEPHLFSVLTFSNVPETTKNDNLKFENLSLNKGTSKSIQILQNQKISQPQTARQNKSFIKELDQSQIMKQAPVHNSIFRERDNNEAQSYQSLDKKSSFVNKNHQSQTIIVEKPCGYQSNIGWTNPRSNYYQGMNQSLIQNSPHFSHEKPNRNSNSQVSFNLRNQPAANQHLRTKQPQAINQIGKKFNFVPQIYESSNFNKTHDFGNSVNESKKIKKTGLSIFKANQPSTKGQ